MFNLITKPKYHHKPTYDTLKASLLDLRDQCEKLRVKRVAMPHIGCGLDGLSWSRVKTIIEEVFDAEHGIQIECFEFRK